MTPAAVSRRPPTKLTTGEDAIERAKPKPKAGPTHLGTFPERRTALPRQYAATKAANPQTMNIGTIRALRWAARGRCTRLPVRAKRLGRRLRCGWLPYPVQRTHHRGALILDVIQPRRPPPPQPGALLRSVCPAAATARARPRRPPASRSRVRRRPAGKRRRCRS